MLGCKRSKASLAKIWLLFGQGPKLIKSLSWPNCPNQSKVPPLGSNVRVNAIDVIDDNHDDTDDDGANVDADSTWY